MTARPMIAKLHIAKAQLGLDDETYRAMLERITGRRSAKDCSAAELERALAECERLGFRPVKRPFKATSKDHLRIIYKLWGDLDRAGHLTDGSHEALRVFAMRQTGKAQLDWLGPAEASKVTEAMKAWLARVRSRRGERADA